MKTQYFPLNIIVLSLLAIAGSAWAAENPPFANAPLHLNEQSAVKTVTVTTNMTRTDKQTQSTTTTTTTAPGVKPNIMLVLDDSGSMKWDMDGRSPAKGKQRIKILQDVMNKVLTDPQPKNGKTYTNGERANWGLIFFNNTSRDKEIQESDTWYTTINQTIQNTTPNGGTPTVGAYLRGAEKLNEAIKYRCQKNYLVLLTDGQSNFNSLLYNDKLYDSFVSLSAALNRSDFWYSAIKQKEGKTLNKQSNEYKLLCPSGGSFIDAYAPNATNRYVTCAGRIPFEGRNDFVYYPYHGVTDDSSDRGWRYAGNYYYRYFNSDKGDVRLLPNYRADHAFFPREFLGYNWWGQPVYGDYQNKIFYSFDSVTANAPQMLRYLGEALDSEKTDLRVGGTDGYGESWDDAVFKRQMITTFTIGFSNDAGDSETVEFLKGGATPNVKDGKGNEVQSYFSATSEDQLQKAFNSILDTVASQNPDPVPGQPQTVVGTPNAGGVSSGAPIKDDKDTVAEAVSYAITAPSGVGTGASKGIPNMAASVYLPAGLRSSQLRFYKLGPDGSPLKKDGEFVFTQPDFSGRKALINNGTSVEWANTSTSTVLNNDFFKLLADSEGRNNEWSQALLPWVSRYTSQSDNEIRAKNYPTPYRIRPTDERRMGDVLDTPVVALGAKDIGNRQEFLVTAANDGLVYLFQSLDNKSDEDSPYALRLNYSPAAMPRQSADDMVATKFKDIADEQYTKDAEHPHLFLINGGITMQETPNGQIFMLGNMGQGARGMYALNVGGKDEATGKAIALSNTDSDQWKVEVPLFEARGTTHTGMGYTVGTPLIGRIGVEYANKKLKNGLASGLRYGGFLGSGFGFPTVKTQETALYIFDILGKDAGTRQAVGTAGTLLAKVTVPGGEGGLATPTIVDINYDGVVDYAFAGDYGGNMYRFDLRTYPNIAVTKIYTSAAWDGDFPRQPITSAPAISKRGNGRYVVIFGTGSDIYGQDFTEKKQQAVYGIYQQFDQDMNAVNPMNNQAAGDNSVSAGDLLSQKLEVQEINGQQYRKVTNEDIFKDGELAYPGWRVALDANDGERVVVKPEMVLGTVILATRVYTQKDSVGIAPDWSEKGWAEDGWKQIFGPDNGAESACVWSDWKKIGESSDSSSGGGTEDRCLGETSSSTVKKERECTVNWTMTSKYQQIIPGKTESYGWILTLNANNGGQLSTGIKDGSKKDAGVDFLGQFDDGYQGEQFETFPAGIKVSGGLPSLAILSGDKLDSPVTADGDSGGSGKMEETGKLTSQRTDCFINPTQYLQESNTGEGLGNTRKIIGPECQALRSTYRRISWREIF